MSEPAGGADYLTAARLRAYLLGRFALVMTMAGALRSGLSFQIESYDQSLALDVAVVGVLLATVIGLLTARKGNISFAALTFGHLLIDPFFAGLITFATGAEESPLTFAFLLVVINGTNMLGRRGAYAAATLSMLSLAVITLSLGPHGVLSWHWPAATEVRSVATHSLAFLAAAWLASALDLQTRVVKRELAKLRDLHERMVEHMPHGLLVVDAGGQIAVANPTARSMIGAGRLVGRSLGSVLGALGRVPSTGFREITHRVGDDERVLRVVFTPFSEGILVTVENLTELYGMQQQMVFSSRMATIGRMAAGLAHELRNPLGHITGAAQEVERCDGPEMAEERKQLLQIMRQEGDRLNRLVEEFLTVAQPRRPELKALSLEAVVADVVDAYEQGPFGRQNPIKFDPGGDHLVAMEVTQFHQLIHNLLANAAQASKDSQLILVSSARMAGSSGALDDVVLSIEDSGCGIPKSDLQRVFDPFYSRRRGGGGSGLGLAVVMRIVVDHGGHIEVDSELDVGTTIHLFFPISRGLTDAEDFDRR